VTVASLPPSLFQLFDPEVLADPYPLYRRLQTERPVYWDPVLHLWVVTRYADVVRVLHDFSAKCAPTPAQVVARGLPALTPIAEVMVRQMLFLDPPDHTRLRALASAAFTPARVERLRGHIQEIVDGLIDRVIASGRMDVIADFAGPMPSIVTAELLGVPAADHPQLRRWSADFAEMLGNFQPAPDRIRAILRCVEEVSAYFRARLAEPHGLVEAMLNAVVDGARLSEDEIVANLLITMVGAQETTTNLIGNGLVTLLRHPEELERMRSQPDLLVSGVEELLRFESPSQHTARIALEDVQMGGETIKKGQTAIAVMAAANRDPARFPDPDRLDVGRTDNRHLAFGWAAHFCFGAALARIEGQAAFGTILRRLPNLALDTSGPLVWRSHLGLRGLKALPVRFGGAA